MDVFTPASPSNTSIADDLINILCSEMQKCILLLLFFDKFYEFDDILKQGEAYLRECDFFNRLLNDMKVAPLANLLNVANGTRYQFCFEVCKVPKFRTTIDKSYMRFLLERRRNVCSNSSLYGGVSFRASSYQ